MKTIKRSAVILMTVSILLAFSACATSPFDYDKDAAAKQAEEVVTVINTRDYDAIYSMFHESLKSLISAAELEEAWEPYLEPAGAFVKINKIDTAGQLDENDDPYIVAAASCKYENKTYVYTIIFDTDLNVTGLYLK